MVAKPKTASWWGRNKTIVLVTLVGMALVVVALLAFIQSQRPNYRDLEREFNALKIPADWKLESQSQNKGFLGLVCLQIAGEACPYLSSRYSANYVSIEQQQALSQQIVGTEWKYLGLFNEETCKENSNPLNCEYLYDKDSMITTVGFSNISSTSESGFYSSVSVSSRE